MGAALRSQRNEFSISKPPPGCARDLLYTGFKWPEPKNVWNYCTSKCSFVIDHLNPDSAIYLFVVYLCEHRGHDTFYVLTAAFDIPADLRLKIKDNNSSLKLQCIDALHAVYHRHNQLTLAMIKTTLSKYSDELQHIISDYSL